VVHMFVLSCIFACILAHCRRLVHKHHKERSPVVEPSKTLLLYEFDCRNPPTELVRLTVPEFTWLSMTAFSDILIASAILYYVNTRPFPFALDCPELTLD